MGLQLIMTKTDDCADEVHYGLVDFSEVKSEYSLKLLQLEINPKGNIVKGARFIV